MKIQLATLVAAVAVTGVASAAALDAASFTNNYTGAEIYDGTAFVNDWSATGGANPANPSLAGSVLTLTMPGPNGWVQQDTGATDWEGITGSWTLEAEITLAADSGIALWADTGATSVGTILYIGANGLGDGGDGTGSNQAHSSASNVGTHIFRLASDSSTGMIDIYRDGVLVTTIAAGGVGGGQRLIVGDCCSGGTGVVVDSYDIGYVAYDTTGAFTPVPSPRARLASAPWPRWLGAPASSPCVVHASSFGVARLTVGGAFWVSPPSHLSCCLVLPFIFVREISL